MDYPKIVKVKPSSSEYTILVLFSDGTTKYVNLQEKIKENPYIDLQNKNFFQQITVDAGGYGVSWNDEIDMSEYELWSLGDVIEYSW